jgi:hypothetical protein
MVTEISADEFFSQLAERVRAVEELNVPESVSLAVARQSVKRYLDDPGMRIRLHDFTVGEAARVRKRIDDTPYDDYQAEFTPEALKSKLGQYERLTEVLRNILATGCYWGNEDQQINWSTALERLATIPERPGNVYVSWERLRLYPALISLYTAGIAAVAAARYSTLFALLSRQLPSQRPDSEREPLISRLIAAEIFDHTTSGLLYETNVRYPQAIYHYLWNAEALWAPLREFIPDNGEFQANYDRFEYLFSIVFADYWYRTHGRFWAPMGMFALRNLGTYRERFTTTINAEIEDLGANWPPLRAGMLGGSLERLTEIRAIHDDRATGFSF